MDASRRLYKACGIAKLVALQKDDTVLNDGI